VAISLVSAAVFESEEVEKERVSRRLFVFFSLCVVSREEGKLLLSAGFLKQILLIYFCFVCVCVFFCSGRFFQFLI
jgi:hypothetical protein